MSTSSIRPSQESLFTFQQALNKPLEPSLAFMQYVTQKIEAKNWREFFSYITPIGPFRKWEDKVHIQDVLRNEFYMDIDKHGTGVRLKRDDIEDGEDTDRIKYEVQTAAKIGEQARLAPYQQAGYKLANGATGLNPIDGVAHFSVRPNADNVITGSGVTLANIKTDLNTIYGRMFGFQDPTLKTRLELSPAIIYADPVLIPTFSELVGSQAGQGTNLNSGAKNVWSLLKVYPLADLHGTNDWIACADPVMSGGYTMYWMNRRNPIFMIDEDMEADTITYIGRLRMLATYGWYTMSCLVLNA